MVLVHAGMYTMSHSRLVNFSGVETVAAVIFITSSMLLIAQQPLWCHCPIRGVMHTFPPSKVIKILRLMHFVKSALTAIPSDEKLGGHLVKCCFRVN